MTNEKRIRPLVLVVEDYKDARELYVHYFKLCGFDVAEAKTGPEALDQAAQLLPDIILMDLALPQLDGCEVTRRLRRGKTTRHIPVLALTGHALESQAEAARRAGCAGFVTKPCMPDDLVAEMRRLLDTTAAASGNGKERETLGEPGRD